MVGLYSPLANTVTSLPYFADYSAEEYEPVLDENMIVYPCGEVDADTIPNSGSDGTPLPEVEDFLYLGHKTCRPHQDSIRQLNYLFRLHRA